MTNIYVISSVVSMMTLQLMFSNENCFEQKTKDNTAGFCLKYVLILIAFEIRKLSLKCRFQKHVNR